jgi:hypothetical protein
MARINIGILVSALALGTGGCIGQGRVSGQMGVSTEPMLVEINPGVWVIEDYSEPVFYVDGFYWLYRDDVWFRSSYHTGGWARIQSAPQVVVSIQRPTAYVHYRAAPGVRVRSGPRGNVIVRRHEEPRGQPRVTRDTRSPRSDERTPVPHPPDRPRATPQDEGQNRRGDKPDKQDKQDTRGNKPDKQNKPDDKQRGDRGKGDQRKHP